MDIVRCGSRGNIGRPSHQHLLGNVNTLTLTKDYPITRTRGARDTPNALSPITHGRGRPFCNGRRTKVLAPRRTTVVLITFSILTDSGTSLRQLFHLLARHFTFLARNKTTPRAPGPHLPPLSSNVLNNCVTPSGLAVALSINRSLFSRHFNLTPRVPGGLRGVAHFPGSSLSTTLYRNSILLRVYTGARSAIVRTLHSVVGRAPSLLDIH